MKGILGRKVGMTEVFTKDGKIIPVTVISVEPNVIMQVKTTKTDGYEAIQLGVVDKKESRANKAEIGHAKKAGSAPKRFLKEIRVSNAEDYTVGSEIKADIFEVGEKVDVTGTSKGKGFSGAIKRWHYTIGPKGHGSGYHRGAGSYATNGRTNNRIHLGKKSAGHHGNDTTTILNLLVVGVDVERNALLVKGAIPGPKKSIVVVRSAIKEQRKSRVAKTLVDNTK